jgi:hypothetical protein
MRRCIPLCTDTADMVSYKIVKIRMSRINRSSARRLHVDDKGAARVSSLG